MKDWPNDVPTTGTVIQEMTRMLLANDSEVEFETLQGWCECVSYCAALLDPDNPPLTGDQLAKMTRVSKPG